MAVVGFAPASHGCGGVRWWTLTPCARHSMPRSGGAPGPTSLVRSVEADAGVLRQVTPGTQTSRVAWSELHERLRRCRDHRAGAVLRRSRHARSSGSSTTTTSLPDLTPRLLAAGFAADDQELMLVAETASIDSCVRLPDGVRLDLVTDRAGVEAMMAVHDLAFTGHPSPRARRAAGDPSSGRHLSWSRWSSP